ncbi:hypothetical protein E2C01_059254 [Portunus trituberculatus]|uniref:Uncharacterized protein n=1 Tax=Portunus trituberculatus TaxID=210409 RepID=A0A5B7H5C4_PORTR|nr:hypothetical protein [Portunus trituberculatus]
MNNRKRVCDSTEPWGISLFIDLGEYNRTFRNET